MVFLNLDAYRMLLVVWHKRACIICSYLIDDVFHSGPGSSNPLSLFIYIVFDVLQRHCTFKVSFC